MEGESNIEALEDKIEALEDKIEELKGKIEDFEGEIANLEDEKMELENSQEEAERKHSEFEYLLKDIASNNELLNKMAKAQTNQELRKIIEHYIEDLKLEMEIKHI